MRKTKSSKPACQYKRFVFFGENVYRVARTDIRAIRYIPIPSGWGMPLLSRLGCFLSPFDLLCTFSFV